MPKIKLHWQILIAIALAVVAGLITGHPDETALGARAVEVYDFFGTLFISALLMIIVPLIVSSIIIGIAGIAREGRLGALGGKTLGFYIFTGLVAVIVGLVAVNMARPGFINGEPAGDQLALDRGAEEVVDQVEEGGAGELVDIFHRMIPENVIRAAADNELLGLIFFALLFGFFMTRAKKENADTLYRFWDGVFDVMMRITYLVMLFAPIGVFGLVAKVAAETGVDAAGPLAIFALTVVAALAAHVFIVMPIIIRVITGHNPYRLYMAMGPALLTAFSTASSMATLPITMDCVRKNVGVSQKTSSFVLPLGATVNMNGTALYECVAAIFIAQAYGLDLTFGVQFTIVVAALVTSIGVAGVPMASMVAIGIILTAVGLPLEALGLLFVFDRILDMLRTATNIYGDGVCALIVAHLEGEKDLLPKSQGNVNI
ncbi:Na+/H+-dicarboxylate symporter [Natronospira proteinivora]|uniref:Na+/H+-dicarboxylate symporter n=1 Tax=Natronospira proteinivora TaxID=1807133 RepID=A0ABT1G701_9GAMM|nr:dicarboxylate/amino acid:cation symporter [Natronospira proteinivora]MCP1727078.1 Na+/H+-dicarboxylate symporter [Natronospira proteinivora]